MGEALRDLERLRRRAWGLQMAAIVVAGITLVAFYGSAYWSNMKRRAGYRQQRPVATMPDGNLAIGLFIAAGALGIASWATARTFRRNFKATVVPRLLAEVSPSLRWSADRGLPELQLTGLFHGMRFNRTVFDDLIAGTVAGVVVKAAEVSLRQHTRRRNSSSTTTVFRGLVIAIKLPIQAPCAIVGRPRTNQDAFGELVSRAGWRLGLSSRRPMSVVQLNDRMFSTVFEVLAHDPDAARSVLIDPMRSALLAATAMPMQRRCHFAFWRDGVYIGMPLTRNFLEPSLSKPVDTPDGIASFAAELAELERVVRAMASHGVADRASA
jgi:hypothetical protein